MFQMLLEGVWQGMSGLLSEPIKGASKDGVTGAIKVGYKTATFTDTTTV